MFSNLLKIAVGFGLIIGGGILEFLWLGFLFGSVVGVVLLLLFAPHLFLMPWSMGFAAGMTVLSGVDEKPFEGAGEIAESVGSAAKKTGVLFVRFLVIMSAVALVAFALSFAIPYVKKMDFDFASKKPTQTYRPTIPQNERQANVARQPADTRHQPLPQRTTQAPTVAKDYVVAGEVVELLNKPGPDAYLLTLLFRNDRIEVHQFDGDWAEVSCKGRDGWVLRNHIKAKN